MGTDTSKDKAEAIKSLYSQRDKFILIGLSNGVQGVQTRLKRKDRFESK